MISVSTTKSGSNWLDRLRTSRGFPTGGELDLDRCLASSSSSGSVPTDSATHSESTQPRNVVSGEKNDVGEVSGVLCDLFNMGECARSFSKHKNCRKQANPRFFPTKVNENNNVELCSSDDLRRERSENDNGLASSGDNSLNEKRDRQNVDDTVHNHTNYDCNDDDDNDTIDLKEYSRSEVTIIDTSFDEWKTDKWVFRKNDEWKIKEKKKIKSRGFVGKRKKLEDDEMKNNNKDKEEDVEKHSVLQLNKGRPSRAQNDKEGEAFKETTDFLGKAPQKRFPCPRPPEKSTPNEGSRVVLLKSIPPCDNSNNGVTRLGKSSQKKRPKKMKII